MFKPNYNQQRVERNRLKQAKKDAELREKEKAREHQKLTSETSARSSQMPGDEARYLNSPYINYTAAIVAAGAAAFTT